MVLLKARGKKTKYQEGSSQDIGKTFLYLFGDPLGTYAGRRAFYLNFFWCRFAIGFPSLTMVRVLKCTLVLDISV